jgi:hypothetical protein
MKKKRAATGKEGTRRQLGMERRVLKQEKSKPVPEKSL